MPPACLPGTARVFASFNSSYTLKDDFPASYQVRTYRDGVYESTITDDPFGTYGEMFDSVLNMPVSGTNLWWSGSYADGSFAVACGSNWASPSQVGMLGNATTVRFGATPCTNQFEVVCACTGQAFATPGPTRSPSRSPFHGPTKSPSRSPSRFPSASPTRSPTRRPTAPTIKSPTRSPVRSPTVAPAEPTSAPTVPTAAPTPALTCEAPTTEPVCSGTVTPTLPPDTEPQPDAYYIADGFTYVYDIFNYPACALPAANATIVYYKLMVKHAAFADVFAFFCKNPQSITYDLNVEIVNVTGYGIDYGANWTSPYLYVAYMPELDTAVVTAINNPSTVIFEHNPTLQIVVLESSVLQYDGNVIVQVTENDAVRYVTAPDLTTTQSDLANLVSISVYLDDLMMAIDLRSFTGVFNVTTPSSCAVNIVLLPNLERIRLDSWVYAHGTFTINPESPRFAQFMPNCSTAERSEAEIPEAVANCSAPSDVPDHDYFYACTAPIAEACEAGVTAYNASCWLLEDSVDRFNVTDYWRSNLSYVDCVMNANNWFTISSYLAIYDSGVFDSLAGLPRVRTADFYVVDSRLPNTTDLTLVYANGTVSLDNVRGMATLIVTLSATTLDVRNCADLEELTLPSATQGSGDRFVFHSNPLLEAVFPACVGTMTYDTFIANCFAPAPTAAPTSPVACAAPTSLPVCVGARVAREADFDPAVPQVPAYYLVDNITLPNASVIYNAADVLATWGKAACALPPVNATLVYGNLYVTDSTYQEAAAFFCKNQARTTYYGFVSFSNVTGYDVDYVNWTASMVQVDTMPQLTSFTVTQDNNVAYVLSISNPALEIIEWQSVIVSFDPTVVYAYVQGNPSLRLFSAPLLQTTSTNDALAVSISMSASGLMSIDFGAFTGVMSVDSPRAVVVDDCEYLERIHLDSWTYVDVSDYIRINPGSARFAAFLPNCPTTLQTAATFLETVANCTAASPLVPDHDYRYACTAPIGEACVDSSRYYPYCWLPADVTSSFEISGYERANLSYADCVMNANDWFTISGLFRIIDSNITDSLAGLSRVRTVDFEVDNSHLPNRTDSTLIRATGTVTFNDVSSMETLVVSMQATTVMVINCNDLVALELPMPSTDWTTSTFVFSGNAALQEEFPSCEGSMDLTAFLANCFTDFTFTPTASPTLQPTGIPTTAPTSSPTVAPSRSPTAPTPPTVPTLAPIHAPTRAPVPTPNPTAAPTSPTASPTTSTPTRNPTTKGPSASPTTRSPTAPTRTPTTSPTQRTCSRTVE